MGFSISIQSIVFFYVNVIMMIIIIIKFLYACHIQMTSLCAQGIITPALAQYAAFQR